MWHRDTKQAGAVGKVVLMDLLDEGYQKFSICEKHSIWEVH